MLTVQTLVFDLSNVAYISSYQLHKGFEHHDFGERALFHSMTRFMRRLYRQFRPEQVIFACDHENYWRRELFPEYKAHRPNDALKKCVKRAIKAFKETNQALCIESAGCEADDVIYGLSCQVKDKLVIVSSDGDFVQLMNNEVEIFNPQSRKYREPPKDAALELFIKCIRGDKSDNIPSAYPRITTKRLERAFYYQPLLEDIMATVLPSGEKVIDRYAFNRQLIDLSEVPDDIAASLEPRIQEVIA